MPEVSYLSQFVHSAKLVGVASSGMLSGYLIASSTNTIPALLAARVPSDKLAQIWSDHYLHGHFISRSSVWISSAAFAFASYQRYFLPGNVEAYTYRNLFQRWTGFSEWAQLALAGAFVFSIGPVTTFFMDPTYNKRLELAAASTEAAKSRSTSTVRAAVLDDDAVREDVEGWNWVNSIRAGLTATGFAIGLLSL
ncbi:hypothetical protein FRC03_006513 [Tulasnella sp. 419]|nr:hypothetical protein FRC03_006513 [Tulasnella sp. 419]